jgi:glycosyltransferase involved in cell wall biosynthesis
VAAARSEPLVSVAVPTCNGAAHITDALRSISGQEDVPFELIICDDRSDDGTLDLVRTTARDRARIEVNAERLGLAGNWNRCLTLSRAPWVAIFHQDDVMLPGHLKAHAAICGTDPAIGLVASAAEVIDERGDPIGPDVVEHGGLGPGDRILDPGCLAPETLLGNPLRCSAVTINRTACADIGGFDPAYRYVLDWDFWLRLSRRWKVAWLARPTVQVRWHAASETHRFKAGSTDLDETARLLEQLFAVDLTDIPQRDSLRKAANQRLGRAFLNRAHDALRAGRTELARDCLRRALGRSPGLITAIVSDPRLAVQMTALTVAPRLASRWFGAPRVRKVP